MDTTCLYCGHDADRKGHQDRERDEGHRPFVLKDPAYDMTRASFAEPVVLPDVVKVA